jgi:invasion protein IalB
MKNLIILFITSLCLTSCREQKTVQATVLSHAVTSDRTGERTYITIIRTDDGYIEEKTGLSYYALPVGNKVRVKVWR